MRTFEWTSLSSRILVLGWLMIIGSKAGAIFVEVINTRADYCIDGEGHVFSGEVEALVWLGTPPYRYDWYDVSFGQFEICMDCGPQLFGLEGLHTYSVVVTDGLGASAEASVVVQGIAGPYFNDQTLAYEAGTAPVLIGEILNEMYWNDPNSVVEVVSISPTPIAAYGPWAGLDGLYKAQLPIGTTGGTIILSATDGIGYCQNQYNFTIDPPTVIPDIEVLDVEGSCSTVGTGSATVRFTNGYIPSGMNIILSDGLGSSLGVGSVGQQPFVWTFQYLRPGDYWAIVSGDLYAGPTQHLPGFTYTCLDSVPFTIPDLGPTCGVVTGTLFLDNNLDCVKQTSERGIPSTVLEVLPGPYYTTTDAGGAFGLVLPLGSYSIQEQSTVVDEHCAGSPIPFTISAASTVTVDQSTVSVVPLDVHVAMTSGPARPGFVLQYGIQVSNLTVGNTGNVTVTMQLDPSLAFLSASPSPSSVSGSSVTWNLPAMPVFQQRSITLRAQVPADVGLLGTALVSTVSVTTALTDGNLANNTDTDVRTVTGSFDPNDKVARTGTGDGVVLNYAPESDDWIDYTIRFQNTGTDTAFHVSITDTLHAGLDPGSLRMGAASHPFQWELTQQGVLKVRFPYILLPDSNVNESRSHGFVSFRIAPHEGTLVDPGDQVSNTANIFFDFNPPVITEPCIVQVPTPYVAVRLKALLGGVNGAETGMMDDALRTQGLVPVEEPFTALGYAPVGSDPGNAQPGVFTITGPDAIVDWVLVELRDPFDQSMKIATRTALLQRDGDVVDMDGVSPVIFAVPSGNYGVALRHRNHAGVMTASAIALSAAPAVIDMTQSSTATFGSSARMSLGGRLCLWPGDVNHDGQVKYAGADNDRDLVLQAIGGLVPTNTLINVYEGRDVNLDGAVKYAGENNDRDLILQTIGGSIPTAVRHEQLP
ncbi:MAG: hypothetical protein H6592_02480 [Flavobacteriales bacterium]|nr:hypothetical protein [Flavobacteriales bacterium]